MQTGPNKRLIAIREKKLRSRDERLKGSSANMDVVHDESNHGGCIDQVLEWQVEAIRL